MTPRAFQVTRAIRYLTLVVSLALAVGVAIAFAPTLFGRQVLVVTSGSMEPWAPVGSIVITRTVPVSELGAGDVITYRPEGGATTTHRIVEVAERDATSGTFVTRGDANEDADPQPVRLVGEAPRAERVLPHLGRLLSSVRTPYAFLALILLGLASSAIEKASARLPVVRRRSEPILG